MEFDGVSPTPSLRRAEGYSITSRVTNKRPAATSRSQTKTISLNPIDDTMLIGRGLPPFRAGARRVSSTPPYQGKFSNSRAVRVPIPPTDLGRRQASTFASAKALYRANPFQVSLAMIMIGAGAGFLSYGCYFYIAYISPIDQKFPEPVAKKLKRALYYSNSDVDPPKALAYYKQALALADEHGIKPFSDEVIGIKITVAAMLENIGQYRRSIEVLELIRADCWKWIETVGAKEDMRRDRTRILGKTVAIGIKLGELYANEYIDDLEQAEKNLVQAVETSLKEQKRREDDELKDDEGPWLNDEAIGGSLEALANHYEQKSQHSLSAPLYLRALTLSPPPCHAVVLMNNLSISLAQTAPGENGVAHTSRAALIANARSWAEKALNVAASIQPPERSGECDTGCAVATHNLAEFAEMEGLYKDAEKKYHEAASLARAIGFSEGMQNAREGLSRVAAKASY